MDFLGDTTHHDYKAMAPVWPALLNSDVVRLRDEISNGFLAIELEQDRMRSLFPRYSKMKWDGASSDDVLAKEAELKETSGKLKSLVQQFEVSLAEWEEKVVKVEEKGEKRKRGSPEGLDAGGSPPPATKTKTSKTDTASGPSRFEEPPPTIRRPLVQDRYKIVRGIDPRSITVGDIGWAPLPRMSLDSSTNRTIPSEYGNIIIKVYPFIIVKKLDDCMLGIVISTAKGQGLDRKGASVRQRSTYVTGSNFKGFDNLPYGWAMSPRCQNLVVSGTG